MTTVLALDLATNSGYAVVDDNGVRAIGSWRLDEGIRKTATKSISAVPINDQHVIQCQRLRRWVGEILSRFEIDFVVIEKDTGRFLSAILLARLQAAAHEAAYDARVPSVISRLGDWRGRIHGEGYLNDKDFLKAEALRICAVDGVAVPDADAAEAYLIGKDAHAYGLDALRADEKETKKQKQRKAVKARKVAREAVKAAVLEAKMRAPSAPRIRRKAA